MSIGKYLDISTAHLTQNDMELLQAVARRLLFKGDVGPVPVLAEYPEGVFCYVPSDLDDNEEVADLARRIGALGVSESFLKVLLYAHRQDCYIVRFDADGDPIDDPALDLHEW